MSASNSIKLFVFYSHKDSDWLDRLKEHLDFLKSEKLIHYFSDSDLIAGYEQTKEVENAINDSNVVLFISSMHLLNSNLLNNKSITFLLDPAQVVRIRILTVLIGPCLFENSILSKYRLLNSIEAAHRALNSAEQEALLALTARAVRDALKSDAEKAPVLVDKTADAAGAAGLKVSEKRPKKGWWRKKRDFIAGTVFGSLLMKFSDAWDWWLKQSTGAQLAASAKVGAGLGAALLGVNLMRDHLFPTPPKPRPPLSSPADLAPPGVPIPPSEPPSDLADPDALATLNYRPRMREIRPSSFQMGSTEHRDEKQPHRVELTHAFELSETEVTQSQYQALMGENPSHFKNLPDWENLPVESVTWFDAVEYCNKLSIREHLEPCYILSDINIKPFKKVGWPKKHSCHGYRLPTEAEWEYAARANKKDDFAGSSLAAEVGWFKSNSSSRTHRVKTANSHNRDNGWGLFDMGGNVWEWVWDGFSHEGYPHKKSAQTDPISSEQGPLRAFRGGSWREPAENAHVTRHDARVPNTGMDTVGIRVARSIP